MSTARKHRTRITSILLSTLTGGALLCGCATGTPSSAGTTASEAQLWAAATACVRANGMPDFPDPVVESNGHYGWPDSAPRTTPQVEQNCRAQFAALPPGGSASPAPPSAADLAQLRSLATCLRSNGYPGWPDPGSDGRFPLAQVSAIAGFKKAVQSPPVACAVDVPAGGIHVGG
jgi:hypothetical protein